VKIGKVARVVGIVGGVGAVAWAMRDRFVTLALSREPERPSFTLPPEQTETISTEPDDLTNIAGIGPVFARRLMEAGIATYVGLATADPQRISDIVNVTEARASKWIEAAGSRAAI